MSESMRLSIPDIPVSPNGPGGYLRMHWAKRAKYTESWAWAIRKAMGYPGIFELAPAKASVTITQYRKKLLDPDNLFMSVKPIMDGLVDWELLYDDSPAHCDLTVKQEQSREVHTEIVITPLPSEDIHAQESGDAA